MFGKKILSVVGLLFLSKQIIAEKSVTYNAGDSSCNVEDVTTGQYYAVSSTTESGEYSIGITNNYKKIVKITGSDDSCEPVTAHGYYITGDGGYYALKQDNSVVDVSAADQAACSGAGAGKFTSGGAFCLDSTVSPTLGDSKLYLFTDSDSVFKAGGSSNVIIKSSEATSIVLDTSLNDAGDVCVDESTKIVTTRPKNYCGSDDCDKYYACTSDVCVETTNDFDEREEQVVTPTCDPTDSTKQANCSPGYYVVTSANVLLTAANSDTTNKLYHCSGTSTDADYCKQDQTTVGYLVNADTGKENAPYIVCKATTSTVDRGEGTMVTKNECDAIKPDGTAGVGKLIEEGGQKKLCIDISNKIVVGTASSYLVDAMTASTFVPSEKVPEAGTYYVLVNMDSDGNVILNAQEKIKYRYAHTGNEDTTKTRRVYEKDSRDASMCSGNSLNGTNAKEYVLNYTDGDKVDFYKASA